MDNMEKEQHTGAILIAFWLVITVVWWALAFAPVQNSPEWLTLARSVCFGSTDNGLPDTYGWVMLFAAPGSLLVGILGTWGTEIKKDTSSIWASPGSRSALIILMLCLGAGIFGVTNRVKAGLAISNFDYSANDYGDLPEDYPRLNKVIGEFDLLNQHGAPVSNENLNGAATLMTFAFGHCQTVCPVVVHTVKQAAELILDQPVRTMVITLDPWRDTPTRLHHMQHHWELPDDAQILSGEIDEVLATLKNLNVASTRDEKTGDIAHPPLVYVLDQKGNIAYAFTNPPAKWLIQAVDRLKTSGDMG